MSRQRLLSEPTKSFNSRFDAGSGSIPNPTACNSANSVLVHLLPRAIALWAEAYRQILFFPLITREVNTLKVVHQLLLSL